MLMENPRSSLSQTIPALNSMVRPMLIARAALREQFAVLHRMLLTAVREDDTCFYAS